MVTTNAACKLKFSNSKTTLKIKTRSAECKKIKQKWQQIQQITVN